MIAEKDTAGGGLGNGSTGMSSTDVRVLPSLESEGR